MAGGFRQWYAWVEDGATQLEYLVMLLLLVAALAAAAVLLWSRAS